MGKDINIKHYEVRIPCKTKRLSRKVVEALVYSGYSAYLSYDSFNRAVKTWDVCYSAQPDEVTAVMEDK
jgi:hypothetical protein